MPDKLESARGEFPSLVGGLSVFSVCILRIEWSLFANHCMWHHHTWHIGDWLPAVFMWLRSRPESKMRWRAFSNILYMLPSFLFALGYLALHCVALFGVQSTGAISHPEQYSKLVFLFMHPISHLSWACSSQISSRQALSLAFHFCRLLLLSHVCDLKSLNLQRAILF